MRDLAVTTRRGQVVTVTLARPVAAILAGWKADAVRRRHVVPVKRSKPEGEAQGEPRPVRR